MWTDFNNSFTAENRSKRCHLISSVAALSGEIWMFNCVPLQKLYGIRIMKNRYLRWSRLLFFLFTRLFSKCLPSASACALSHACHWLMDGVNDALFNGAPNIQQAMAQNIAVTLNVVNSTQKKIKLKVNIPIKNTFKFITSKEINVWRSVLWLSWMKSCTTNKHQIFTR